MRKIIICILVLMGCGPAGQKDSGGIHSLNAAQFNDRISDETVILDVRTPQEFVQGFIPGAVNMDYKSADFDQKLDSLDKSKDYLIYCASGIRSSKAADLMLQKGFISISVLDGGIEAWTADGRAVQRN